jgi:RNA polymerase sigma factor (sigma-70 family)
MSGSAGEQKQVSMTNVGDALDAIDARRVFEEFYRKHYNSVLRFAERRIDTETAADVCAECFTIAWRKFDPERPFGITWLYQTTHHLLGNKYRKRARDARLMERLQREAEREQGGQVDAQTELLVAFAQLNHREQEVLRLTYWENLSAAEIALVLKVSEQAVWKRVSRAKSRLQSILGAQNVGISNRKGEADR